MALLFESAVFNLLFLLAGFFLAIYLYVTRNFNFWKKHGFPYEKPLPFVGNLKGALLQKQYIGENLKEIYDKNKDKYPYVGFFSFDQPSLLLINTELIKTILVKDAHNFINRVQAADESTDPITAKAIFALKGQKWKHVRTGMTPIFSSGKMRKMFDIVNMTTNELDKFLDGEIDKGATVEVRETMARFTIDVIASIAFGIESNSLKNPDAEFRRYMRKTFTFNTIKSLATLAISFAPNFQRIFKVKILHDDVVAFLRNTVWSTVNYREKNCVERNDFLHCMMELRKKSLEQDHKLKIDGDDFVAQSFAFLIAGFETSATTISFTLYELALHPNLQNALRKEIVETTAKYNNQLTYDAIKEMKLLHMVISETLRKYPVVPFLDRMTVNDYELPAASGKGTAILKAGTGVYVPAFALHRDPDYYPDPDKYDPERFSEENKASIPPFSYVPFGEGPRNCLGKRFGLMQSKIGVAHIISRYEIAPCKETPIPIKLNPLVFLVQPQGNIPLKFTKLC